MALLSPISVASARFAPGTYHTDGSRLLRIYAGANRELREVEDCRTLDVTVVPLLEIEAMGLSPVRTGPSGLDIGD
jgi:hypothetical protein